MLLTLDNLAHRYKMLPSEVLTRADTLDLHVLDLSGRWQRHQQEQLENKQSRQQSRLSQEQMLAMVKRVKDKEQK